MLELDHKLLGIASPLEHVVVRPLFSFDLWGIEYVAPYSGTAVAEYFMYEHGKDTLCVSEDLA